MSRLRRTTVAINHIGPLKHAARNTKALLWEPISYTLHSQNDSCTCLCVLRSVERRLSTYQWWSIVLCSNLAFGQAIFVLSPPPHTHTQPFHLYVTTVERLFVRDLGKLSWLNSTTEERCHFSSKHVQVISKQIHTTYKACIVCCWNRLSKYSQ